MNSVKRHSSENRFKAKINGVFQDQSFFPSFHHLLIPNVISNTHSEVRGTESSLTSHNSFITDNTEKQRILVVDDDPDIGNLYKLSLERNGFVVDSFSDPLLALSGYEAGAYDLLLLDIKMPQMNGFELYQKIRLADEHTKVCFISAFEEYQAEFKEIFPELKEADCFIRKPIEMESLTKKVKSRLQSE